MIKVVLKRKTKNKFPPTSSDTHTHPDYRTQASWDTLLYELMGNTL